MRNAVVMKKTSKLLLSGAAVTAAAIALTGCTINIGTPKSPEKQNNMMSSEQNSSGFSQQDLMFAQMMIPHHEQAVEMSILAETHTTNPDVLALASQIKNAQEPEIKQMQEWLDASGGKRGGMEMDHMDHGMGMDGMLTDEQMTALDNASGAEFDKLYLEGMIAHHEGAIVMARMITDSSNAEAKTLGEAIVTSQTAEIEKMQQMLASMS